MKFSFLPLLLAAALPFVASAQQSTLDADTPDLPRVFGQTWWFDNNNSGNAIAVPLTNGVSTVEGNLPGWAWTQWSFLRRDASTNAVEATGKVLGNANYPSAGPASVYYDNLTVTTNNTNRTLGWLETSRDFVINSNSTVTVASGGVMFHNNAHQIRSATAGGGNLTSGYSAGGGTNELFLIVAGNSGDYRVESVNIVNNGSTPVAVVVDGVGGVNGAQMGLNRPNTYSGGTYVNGGRLRGIQTGAFGSGPVTVRDAEAQAWLVAAGTFANNFRIAGIGWSETAGRLGAIRFNNGARIGGTVTLTGNARLTPWFANETGYVDGRITGPFALEKTGAGTLVLNNAGNDYGDTLHTAGNLQVGNPQNPTARLGAGAVTVSSAAVLAGHGTVPGPITFNGASVLEPGWLNEYGTFTALTNLAMGASAILRFDVDGTSIDRVNIGGRLNAGGAMLEARVRGPLAPGRRVVATYGSLTNTFNATVVNASRYPMTVDTNTVGEIAVVIADSPVDELVWRPTVNAEWALDANLDWLADGAAPARFLTGDDVLFSDLGALTNTVTITGTLTPGNVTVNSTTNYTFAGAGSLAGTARVTKRGASTLTLVAPGAYTGGTWVEEGQVKLGSATGLPINGAVAVASGATFNYSGFGSANTRNHTFTIAGTGVGGAGALVNSGGSIAGNASLAFLNLSGDASVGGAGRFDIGTSAAGHRFNGNGYSLTKTGANEINLRAQFVTNVASIVVNQGIFKHESFDQTSPATATTTNIVNQGAILRSYGARTFNYPLVFNGLSTLDTENSAAVWTGPVALNGTTTVNTAVANITWSGAVSGLGSLVKTNANSLIVLADSAYAGRTWLRGGRIQVGNNSATGSLGQGTVDLSPGTLLEYLRSNAVDVTSPVTGSGAAEFRHYGTGRMRLRNVNLAGGALLRVGSNALGPATLDVQDGDVISAGRFWIGESTSNSGRIVQTGGAVTVTDGADGEGPVRLGHYPTETSVYDLLGGTLSVPAGRISLGIDGHGVWNVNGGTATVARIEVNGRNSRAGDGGTLNLLAGRLRVGAGGIITEGNPYVVNYAGGILEAAATFTSTVNAALTGAVVFHTGSNTMTHSGVLAGAGGFGKTGAGTLVLSGNNLYSGPVQVLEGELRLTGAHTGGGTLAVSPGARLAGTGATSAAVTVAAGGTLAPGVGVGTLAVNGALVLDGKLEIQVSGATADRVTGVTDLTLGATSAIVLTNTLTAASYTLLGYSGARSGEFGDTSAVTAQGYTVVYDDAARTVRAVFLPAPAVSGLSGGNLVFAWPTRAGHLYTVQYRTNLLGGAWIDLPGRIDLPGTGAPISVTNTLGGEMRAYFRVMNE